MERRQRRNCHLLQLCMQQQARRTVPCRHGLALKFIGEDRERVERASAHSKRPASTAGRFNGSLHARRAPRSRSMAGEIMMDADSSIGRTCSLSTSATSNGSRRCVDAKHESSPELAGARPRGERFGNEHWAPSRVCAHVLVQHRPEEEDDVRIRSEHAMLRQRHDSQTRLPRIGPVWTARGVDVTFERYERLRGDLERCGQLARRELSSQRSMRCRKPASLVGDQSSRPSSTTHASNDASVAGDRPEARSIARLRSSTQPSRLRKKTMPLSGRNRCPPRTV